MMGRYVMVVIVGLVLMSGCASRFTFENYRLVQVGDSREQVIERLGDPVAQSELSPMVFQGQEELIVGVRKDKFNTEAYLTLDDLLATDITRYGAIFAPLPLRMPAHVQRQLVEFVRGGGALVCDIGSGMCETGSWIELPAAMADLFGVERLAAMEEVMGDLRVSWAPSWLPSLQRGARTQGSHRGGTQPAEGLPGAEPESSGVPGLPSFTTGARTDASTGRQRGRGYHVSGPACYVALAPGAGMVATLDARWHDDQRVMAGLVGRSTGPGVACFASHRLWADWISTDPVYAAFHHDLCSRQAKIDMLDVPFWTEGIAATATERGIAVFNAGLAPAGAEVISRAAQHALHTNAFCLYSAAARKPDGTRSGAARLSVEIPGVSLAVCDRLPILVQPYAGACTAHLIQQQPRRLVFEVGGDGAEIVRGRDGALRIASGEPTRIRFTVRDGVYRVRKGSGHHVTIDCGRRSGRIEATLTATETGIRFSETLSYGVVTMTPAASTTPSDTPR